MGIVEMEQHLRELGTPDHLIARVCKSISRKQAAVPLTTETQDRLREVCAEHGTAVITLSKCGRYRVFTPQGHATLGATAKKHRPWEAARPS